ncbi:GntR family transcriptional regulator [Kineococcus sp. DHX-1]|uniref:GntR family transcriptional regulator n=1 Tax=Kineococcus sp. DHX-1 TaxID=3349638 RepID=UPI0036D333DE
MPQPMEAAALTGAQARVLESLRTAIISGDHQPGSPLSEIALAEQHGVSRTPVREALKQLQIEGLIEVRPRVGTFVRAPSRREIIELFELKEVLEGMGARLLAARGRVPALDELEENLDRARLAVAAVDHEGYADLVHGFHSTIIDGADNTQLKNHYRTLMNQLAYHRLVARSLGRPGRLGASLSEHEKVLQHIREKDGYGAEFAMRDHVRSSERETLSS